MCNMVRLLQTVDAFLDRIGYRPVNLDGNDAQRREAYYAQIFHSMYVDELSTGLILLHSTTNWLLFAIGMNKHHSSQTGTNTSVSAQIRTAQLLMIT